MTKRRHFDPCPDANKRQRTSTPLLDQRMSTPLLDDDAVGLILTYLAESELVQVERAVPEYQRIVEGQNIWGVSAYNQFPREAAELKNLNPPGLPPGQNFHAHCGPFTNRRMDVTSWKEEFSAFASARHALSSLPDAEPLGEITVLDFSKNPLRRHRGKLSTPVVQHIMARCPNLKELYIDGYDATSLELKAHPSLEKFWLSGERLTQLNVTACRGLRTLTIEQCTSLPWLDLNGFRQLETVVLDRCRSLGTVRLDGLSGLRSFELNGSRCLKQLDTTGMPRLLELTVTSCSALQRIRFLPVVPMRSFSFGSNPILEPLDLTQRQFQNIRKYKCDSDLVRGKRHRHTFPSGWMVMAFFSGLDRNWDSCFASSAEQRDDPRSQHLLTR